MLLFEEIKSEMFNQLCATTSYFLSFLNDPKTMIQQQEF